MFKNKGGAAARELSNNDYYFLYRLGFEDGDIEMMEFYNQHINLNALIGEYIRIANEQYNINIDNIETIAESNIDEFPNSNITKRDVAREVVHFFSNQGRTNGGYRRKSLRKKSRMAKNGRYKIKSRRNKIKTK